MNFRPKPCRIGHIEFDPPVALAALAGYSDLPFRLLCRRMGAPFATTEMMLDRYVLLTKSKYKKVMAATCEEDRPCAGQIIGNEPEVMAAAGREILRLGFDAVDLNFACPVRKALRRRRGGWLMNDPDRAVAIAQAVCKAAEGPVILKLRQKFAAADDESSFYRIAEAAFDAGAAAIIVHGRSVEAKYAGRADWRFLERAKAHFADRSVLGSGDVLSPAHAVDMLRQTGVDGCTAARGALGNPWFFRQVQDILAGRAPVQPSLPEQRRVLEEHFAAVAEMYGEAKAARIMRGFGVKYAGRHPAPKAVRMAFVEAKTPKQWHAVLERHYGAE